MRLEKITLRKTCSFYVSDFHLSTLLLPYIVNKIEKNCDIITFLEKSIDEIIEKLVNGLNIASYNKNKILEINWNNSNILKYNSVIKKISMSDKNINVIVSGKKEYIENINKILEKMIQEYNQKGLNYPIILTINNCYHVKDVLKVKEILDKHDMILNTSGETEICSVFDGYKRVGNI